MVGAVTLRSMSHCLVIDRSAVDRFDDHFTIASARANRSVERACTGALQFLTESTDCLGII